MPAVPVSRPRPPPPPPPTPPPPPPPPPPPRPSSHPPRPLDHRSGIRLDIHQVIVHPRHARRVLHQHPDGVALLLVGDGAPDIRHALRHGHVQRGRRRPGLALQRIQDGGA